MSMLLLARFPLNKTKVQNSKTLQPLHVKRLVLRVTIIYGELNFIV